VEQHNQVRLLRLWNSNTNSNTNPNPIPPSLRLPAPARCVKNLKNIIISPSLRVAASEKAEAEKILVVKAAEADAESKHLQGQGIAKQRAAIVDGLKASLTDGAKHLSPEQVTELLLITQFFDTLNHMSERIMSERIMSERMYSRNIMKLHCTLQVRPSIKFNWFISSDIEVNIIHCVFSKRNKKTLYPPGNGKATTIFMPHGPGGMSDMASQIRNGVIAGGKSLIQQPS
jgi:hypothetical protein